jgi:transcriptional regulator with XRE-family HTH domain
MNTRIKEVRKAAKLTQTAFGEKIGLTQNYIALIEGGQREPGDRTIRDICREFGVNEMWLRNGIGEMYLPQDREAEMTGLVKSLMNDSPESFRSALVTTLLRFDPDGPEWEVLERIYQSIAGEMGK